ncbi:MAG: Rhomboid family protein [Lacunisphaera sp.]|nr:Rhomboid family protein [Lacunisphaera sp.]
MADANPPPPPLSADVSHARDFLLRLHRMPAARTPFTSATNLIVALNVAMFIFMGAFFEAGWFEPVSMRPYNLFAASNGAATTDGEWWRLLTSMFAHYGFLHLALNMWALINIGPLLERLFGRALYLVLYLAAGLGGGLLSIAWNGDRVWSAGASGAIFGVYGALLGYLLREKHGLPKLVFRPILKSTLIFAGLNIFFGATRPGIDNACHLGGLATGFLLGWLTALPVDAGIHARRGASRLWLALAVTAAITALGIAFTPRFNYSFRDELTWHEANKDFPDQEQELIKRNNAELQQYQQGGKNRAAYAEWIASEVIPFYARWQQQLAPLALQPGRVTSERSAVVQAMLRIKIAGYTRLREGILANDPQGIADYVAAEQAAMQQLAQLARRKL